MTNLECKFKFFRDSELKVSRIRFGSRPLVCGPLLYAAFACGAEEQTVNLVDLQCRIHLSPHGLHCPTVLVVETIEWLLNICIEF